MNLVKHSSFTNIEEITNQSKSHQIKSVVGFWWDQAENQNPGEKSLRAE